MAARETQYVSRHSITGEQIAELRSKRVSRSTRTLGNIVDARRLLAGELQAPLPKVITDMADGDAFRVDTPQKYTSVMQLRNDLSDPVPELKRPKTATSDRAETTSSRIEKYINPTVHEELSAQDLADLLLVEAEATILVAPMAAAHKKVEGAFFQDDGKTIKPSYQRDAAGKTYDDYLDEDPDEDEERARATFTRAIDEKRSHAVYTRHLKHMRAKNPVHEVRLLSRQQCIPLDPVIKGPDVTVAGALIRTAFTREDLIKQQWNVPGFDTMMEPRDDSEGDQESGMFWLDEAWLTDRDDWTGELYPYVSYSVAGKPSTNNRTGFEKEAVIDLNKQCGLRSLPVVHGYGMRWYSIDPDKRGLPYTRPFMRNWLSGDAFLTGKAYAGWAEAFLAWFLEMPPEMLTDVALMQAWLEFVKTNPMVVEPFKMLPVVGSMKPAVHPGSGRDINDMIAALQGSNQQEIVNPLARGGGDAASAIERSVVKSDTMSGISDVKRSILSMHRRVGELILEVDGSYARKHKQPVYRYGNPETPTNRADSSGTRAILELKPDWLGPEDEESYDLVAYFPKSLGDNLAEKAQAFGFYEKGAITFEMWSDEIGVSDPERFRAQLMYDAWLKTPEGMQVAMKDAAEYLGDKDLVAQFDAQQKQALGPGGEPMPMIAGLRPPQVGTSDPGALAATQMQDPAMNQAAAIAGAGRNADAANVGPAPVVNGTGV